MKVTTAFLTVTDQDAAKELHTSVLGFEVVTDFQGGDFRWLSLRSPDRPDGPELVLDRVVGSMVAVLEERRAAGTPGFSSTLSGPDEFECVRERGAVVRMELTRQEYGGTDGLIEDGCGNIVCPHMD